MSFKRLMLEFKELDVRDFRVLLAVEAGMERHEFVPQETVVAYTNIPRQEALYRIQRIYKRFLLRTTASPYRGYALNYRGYDYLALNAFVKADQIHSIGSSIGVGKESDIYEALSPNGETLAVKFHRLGRTSFRQTSRLRSYAQGKAHWIIRSRLAAEKEYMALEKLYACKVQVPKPIAQNRHAILMGNINGVELAELNTLPQPRKMLLKILAEVKKAYQLAQIIHADLSEYNIIIDTAGSIKIIDWPQYIKIKHPNAEEILKRDLKNLIEYFRRRFKVKISMNYALREFNMV
jgi:RIO kinase 2